jgi:hypothetical protein
MFEQFCMWGMIEPNVWTGPPALDGNHPGNLLELTDEVCPYRGTRFDGESGDEVDLYVGDIVKMHYTHFGGLTGTVKKEFIGVLALGRYGVRVQVDGTAPRELVRYNEEGLILLGNHREHKIEDFIKG